MADHSGVERRSCDQINNTCEQRTFLMRLSNETTGSCMERSRELSTYFQASSIIVITSNGAGCRRSMSQRLLHRQDLRYVQSTMCSIYDIMTFLMARKKPSHFHSDLCYAINAKHLSLTLVQGNANANAPSCALFKRCNGIEQERILQSKVPKFWLQCTE